jgi:hypothetical protein
MQAEIAKTPPLAGKFTDMRPQGRIIPALRLTLL